MPRTRDFETYSSGFDLRDGREYARLREPLNKRYQVLRSSSMRSLNFFSKNFIEKKIRMRCPE